MGKSTQKFLLTQMALLPLKKYRTQLSIENNLTQVPTKAVILELSLNSYASDVTLTKRTKLKLTVNISPPQPPKFSGNVMSSNIMSSTLLDIIRI